MHIEFKPAGAARPESRKSATLWQERLLRLADRDYATPCGNEQLFHDQLLRLEKCISAIPDPVVYKYVIMEYAGSEISVWPRAGQPGDMHPTRPNRPRQELLQTAVDFIRRPARLRYILTGETLLDGAFPPRVVQLLNNHNIYIPDDVDRFRGDDILRDVVYQMCAKAKK